MGPRLPLEVVELIIDNVAAGSYYISDFSRFYYDLSTTKACALVCHSFLPLCRKHMFASVSLNMPGYYFPSPTSDDLNDLLSNSPHLAVYIRRLEYHVHKKEFVRKRLPWLLPMFKKLVNLRNLSLSYTLPQRGKKFDWTLSCVRKVLLPLLHFPTLTCITLDILRNFDLADLAGCVNLKKLRVQSLECSAPNGVGKFMEVLPATPAMLEWLAIDNGNVKPVQQLCGARRPDGKPIIDFSSLKKIIAKVTRLDSMTELFGMCGNLHKIDLIIVRQQIIPTGNPMDTSSLKGLFIMLKPSLPTLVNIDIEYDIYSKDEHDGPLAGLCHELEKMAGQNAVETIELLVWLSGSFDCTRWGELDDVLMGSREDWPALRKVSLSFKLRSLVNNLNALRRLPMTKLMENKRVEFDFQLIESFSRSDIPVLI